MFYKDIKLRVRWFHHLRHLTSTPTPGAATGVVSLSSSLPLPLSVSLSVAHAVLAPATTAAAAVAAAASAAAVVAVAIRVSPWWVAFVLPLPGPLVPLPSVLDSPDKHKAQFLLATYCKALPAYYIFIITKLIFSYLPSTI